MADLHKCTNIGGTLCCASIWISPNDGACCSAYACSDGTSGGSCGACTTALNNGPQANGSEVFELAGVEQITVNNTVLNLQLS